MSINAAEFHTASEWDWENDSDNSTQRNQQVNSTAPILPNPTTSELIEESDSEISDDDTIIDQESRTPESIRSMEIHSNPFHHHHQEPQNNEPLENPDYIINYQSTNDSVNDEQSRHITIRRRRPQNHHRPPPLPPRPARQIESDSSSQTVVLRRNQNQIEVHPHRAVERISRSADTRGRFVEKRTRSRSTEIRLRFAQPPVECEKLIPVCQDKCVVGAVDLKPNQPCQNRCLLLSEPCHSNWNQCYQPVPENYCQTSDYSRVSSRDRESAGHQQVNTTVYCPEPEPTTETEESYHYYNCHDQDPPWVTQHYFEDQEDINRKESSLAVTIMNRQRQSLSIGSKEKYGKPLDRLRRKSNPYDAGNEADNDDDDLEGTPLRHAQRWGQKVEKRSDFRERDIPYANGDDEVPPEPHSSTAGPSFTPPPPPPPVPEDLDPYAHAKPYMQIPKPQPYYQFRVPKDKSYRDSTVIEQRVQFPDNEANYSIPARLEEHSFPFVGISPSGNLKVDPRQVSFENPKSAVLVSNPSKSTVKVRQDRMVENEGVQFQQQPPAVQRIPYPPEYLSREAEKVHRVGTEILDTSPKGSKDFMENIRHRMMKAIDPDTNVIIGDKKFPCHQLALQAYSKYFDKHHRPSDKRMEISLPPHVVSASVFPNLMDWILLDENMKKHVPSRDNVVGLFSAADYLGIPMLRSDCLDFINRKVEAHDPVILKMYEEARDNEHCGELLTLVSAKLASLFPRLYQSKQFLQMNVRELCSLLDADALNIKKELDVFDTAARWLLYDWHNRSPNTIEVMKRVRFGLMSSEQLTQISVDALGAPEYKQIFDNEQVKKMVDDGLKISVWREKYRTKPAEFNKWVAASGIPVPRPRINLESSLRRPPPGDSHKMTPSMVTNDYVENQQTSNNQNLANDSLSTFGNQRHGAAEREKPTGKKQKENDGEWMKLTEEQNKIGAAILIQSRVRGWLARRKYEKLHSAIIKIQAAYRLHKARPHSAKRINKRLRLSSLKKSIIIGNRVRNLTLPDCASVVVMGGHNPLIGPNEDSNTAREIFQLHPIKNIWSHMGQIPEPRIHAGAVLYAGFIIVFGGADPRYKTSRDKSIPCATTWSLQIEGGDWRSLANMITARSNFGYILSHGKIWVFGGVDIEGNALPTCEMFNPETNQWSEIASMDGPRFGVAVTSFADKIWIIGGLTKNHRVPILKSAIIYHIDRDNFSPAPALVYPRAFATATTFYTKIFLFAGAGKIGSDSTRSVDDICIFQKGHWESVAQLASPRHGQCQLKIGKYVLILGGVNSETQEPLNTCEVFNMIKYTVSTKVAPVPMELIGCCGIVIN